MGFVQPIIASTLIQPSTRERSSTSTSKRGGCDSIHIALLSDEGSLFAFWKLHQDSTGKDCVSRMVQRKENEMPQTALNTNV